MLAGAMMQLLFWLSLLFHQLTAGQQPRLDADADIEEPLLEGTVTAVQSLSAKTVRSPDREFQRAPGRLCPGAYPSRRQG